MADKEPVVDRPEDEEEASAAAAAAGGEEEDTGAQVAPIVRLEEVAVTTGEEDEDVLLDMKAKLYRFDKEGNQWKERGTGTVKLLKHKENGKEHAGSDKSCVWHAADFADGELKEEMFAIRFGSVENCKKFKDLVEEISESLAKTEGKETEEDSSAAGLLEKLSVTEKKSEEVATKEESTEAVKETDTKSAATSE
ncbi:hypothetical protein OsJ_18176 [Oryza sativa Japonica Group]|uniref:RanBD1 domain-containing protein n=1 Tax=Oryza sativa subsp. japonica TaxID=39947 RepID=B9FH80_ORYSJ|nr:hypothetical protein OsJ_18176 [Oryza sativa Japonica Group]